MTNPDRRVPSSEDSGGNGDAFFVDITPPEFGQNRQIADPANFQPAPAEAVPSAPNVPGQPTFVERRTDPVNAKDTNGLFFRTPRIKPGEETGKSESAADLESTDELPSVPEEAIDANGSQIETPVADPEFATPLAIGHSSESITQDIPNPVAPGSEHPTDEHDVIGNSDSETSEAAAREPHDDDAAADQPSTEIDTGNSDQSLEETNADSPEANGVSLASTAESTQNETDIPEAKQAQNETEKDELSPAQIQLAELKAMLSEMSKPAKQTSAEFPEQPTSEHPIGDELQAKLDRSELEETAVEVLPKGGDQQQPPPPPAQPIASYFPTPEQKKAHARFLPPETQREATQQPLQLSAPTDDRYGFHDQSVPDQRTQPIPLLPPDSDANNGAAAGSSEPIGEFEVDPNTNANPVAGNEGQDGLSYDNVVVDDRRGQTQPADQHGGYSIDPQNGEYDYDHEYYAANHNSQTNRQYSPGDSDADLASPDKTGTGSHNWAPAGPDRRTEAGSGSRAGDAVDRMRVGRLVFLFLIAGIIGGVWWANSTGFINLNELTDLVTSSEPTESSTNSSSEGDDGRLGSSRTSESPGQEIDSEPLGGSQPAIGETSNVRISDTDSESTPQVSLLIQAETVDGDPMPGVPVEVVTSEDSEILARVETSITGLATYNSENPGCYRIQVQTPAGWVLDDPTGGNFASICGEDSHSSTFTAVFRPSVTARPISCDVRANEPARPSITTTASKTGFADFYTIYDELGRKLVETDPPRLTDGSALGILEWPQDIGFELSEIAALTATSRGEESVPTLCGQITP